MEQIMSAESKSTFIVERVIVFIGAFPFIFLALLFPLLGFKDTTNKDWHHFIWFVAITLFLFFISLFPKAASNVLFWRSSEEKKALYIRRVEVITAILIAFPLIFFLYLLLSGGLGRGLVEL